MKKKSERKPAARNRGALSRVGSGTLVRASLTPDEMQVLEAYRDARADTDLSQEYVDEVQREVELPDSRLLQLTLYKRISADHVEVPEDEMYEGCRFTED